MGDIPHALQGVADNAMTRGSIDLGHQTNPASILLIVPGMKRVGRQFSMKVFHKYKIFLALIPVSEPVMLAELRPTHGLTSKNLPCRAHNQSDKPRVCQEKGPPGWSDPSVKKDLRAC
jgi:hypothetical protein